MRSLPWLLLTLAGVLGGIWLTMRLVGATDVTPARVQVESDSAAPDPAPAPALAPVAVAPRLAESAELEVDPFLALRHRLERDLGTNVADERAALDAVMTYAVEARDERGYELVVEALDHPASLIGSRPGPRFEILGRAWGSRAVDRLAVETIETAFLVGAGSGRAELQRYQVLLATNGRRTGLMALLEQLARVDTDLPKGAAEALKLAQPVDAELRADVSEALFAVLLSPDECRVRNVLAEAIVALSADGALQRLAAIAFEGAEVGLIPVPPDVDPAAFAAELRGSALLALAGAFDADLRDRSLAFHLDRSLDPDPDAALRARVPHLWRLVPALPVEASAEAIEARRELLRPLQPLLRDALGSGESRRVDQALWILEGEAFRSLGIEREPTLAADLAEVRESASATQRARIEALLERATATAGD